MSFRFVISFAAVACLVSGIAFGPSAALAAGEGGLPIGGIEAAFGASNISAVTGNGGLTAGVSREGAVSVLSWPSPSYTDHVHYIAENGVDSPREKPRMGALEGMGIYAGIALKRAGTDALDVTFFPDENWTWRVRYAADDNSVVVTEYTDSARNISVVQTDFIPEDMDVLIRRYRVEVSDTDVESAWLIGYSNITSNLSIIPELPVADFLIEHYNDFLGMWDEGSDSIVHFHPGDTGVLDDVFGLLEAPDRDFGPVGELLQAADVAPEDIQSAVASLDDDYAEGVYVRTTTLPKPDGYQLGFDATETCAFLDTLGDNIEGLLEGAGEAPLPVDPSTLNLLRCGDYDPVESVATAEGWLYDAMDALEDARDGELSSSPVAGAQVNSALRVPLSFEGDVADATIFYAFGHTDAEASTVMNDAVNADLDALERQTAEAHEQYVAELFIPESFSSALKRFSLRTFLNIRVGTDRESGAIVASVSRQAPYSLDWPRDGVFFNQALELAGSVDLVTKRLLWYKDLVRTQEVAPTPLIDAVVPGWPDCSSCSAYPPNAWEMNYYAQGEVGGNIRLEIDNTALLIWNYVSHIGYLPEDERQAYADEIWDRLWRSTNFLAEWRDAETGLVFPANVDDNAAFTQQLQGAVTVYGALRAAAMFARWYGRDGFANSWIDRAIELREATIEHMYREDEGFLHSPDGPVSRGGPSAWIAWPAKMLPWDDERLQTQLDLTMAAQMPRIRGAGEGGSYTTKVAISAALASSSSTLRDEALEMAEILASEVASDDTQQLGEVFINVDADEDGVAEERINAVSTPHLWAATLVYITAMAVHEPELFDTYEDVLPRIPELDGEEPIEQPGGGDAGVGAGGSSDGCTQADGSAPASLLWLFAAAALLGSRRRR